MPKLLPLDPLDRVTGSSYLLFYAPSNARILVDCGLYQDGADPERANDSPFPFDPATITTVVLTHAHLDHCGRLPALVRAGFRGSVVATPETIELAKIVLMDAARLTGGDGEDVRRIRWRPFENGLFSKPLPLANDVFVFFHRTAHIVGAVSAEIVCGPPDRREQQRAVVFSGDLGNNLEGRETQPYQRSQMHVSRTRDVAVVESTYGGRVRDPSEYDAAHRRRALAEAIVAGLQRGGPVILPVFAVQRAQDVLYDLHVLMAEDPAFLAGVPVLLDGPMALKVSRVVSDAMLRDHVSPNKKVRPAWLGRGVGADLGLDLKDPDGLTRARTALRSMLGRRPWFDPDEPVIAPPVFGADAARDGDEPWRRFRVQWNPVDAKTRDQVIARCTRAVVLATGGMAEGGPVQAWLARHVARSEATVLTTGYCAPVTVAGRLLQLATLPAEDRARLQESIELAGEAVRSCDVRAHIEALTGYSGHADQEGLLTWLFPSTADGRIIPTARRVVVTHGERAARNALKAAIEARAAELSCHVAVELPAPGADAIDVVTGDVVPREVVLGTAETSAADLEREIANMQARLAAMRRQPT